MKKVMAILLVICSCIVLCACGKTDSITSQKTPSVWKVEYKTDDFGDPTDTPYLITEVDATYDTKNTTDGQARITFIYSMFESHGNIYGYFSMSAKVGSNDAKKDIRCPATIKLKINDQVYEDWVKIAGGYDVYLYENNSEAEYIYRTIYSALISGSDVQVVFDDYDHTKYKFTIESGNFIDAITPILSQYQTSIDDMLTNTDVNNTAEIDLEAIYNKYCNDEWASLENYGKELRIDTNPDDTHVEDSATVSYKKSSVYDSSVYDAIKAINEQLGLSSDLVDRIMTVRHADGAQYETIYKIDGKNDLRIAWTFHPNKGLIVKYQLG